MDEAEMAAAFPALDAFEWQMASPFISPDTARDAFKLSVIRVHFRTPPALLLYHTTGHDGMVSCMDEITIVEIPKQKVLGMRKTGTYRLIPELLMKVYEYTVLKKITVAGPPLFICHETLPESVREANEKGTAVVEVAWPVTGPAKGSRTIRLYDLPGGKMVRTVHLGPYESCEPTYLNLFAWIAEKRLVISGPIREIYPNDPCKVKPEEIITEIYVPVQ
jgi:effector-binding domain-containing protein